MKRLSILILTAAMLMAWSLPASAKGKKPPPQPERYSVEIAFEGTDGIATSCTDANGNPLTLEAVRTDARRGGQSHFESWTGATLSVEIDDLSAGGYTIETGCHGDHLAPEYFRITLNADASVAVLWIFDVEQTAAERTGKGKPKTVRSDFRMGGPYDANGEFAQWARTTSTVEGRHVITVSGTGDFAFVHYSSQDGSAMIGVRTLTLEMTLTEIG